MEKKKTAIGYIALLVTSLIFGSSFFILKNALDSMPTFFVLAFRFSIGLVIVFLVFIKSIFRMKAKSFLRSLIVGVMLLCSYTLQTLGLVYTTPGKNAFLTATYVIFVPVIMWLFYKKKPTLKNILSAILCITGIGLISLSTDFTIGIGDILTLCSGLFFSLQIVFLKRFSDLGDEPGQLLFGELLVVAVVFWVVTLCRNEVPARIETNQLFPLLYLSFAVTGIAQTTQMLGQKYTSANTASLLISLEAPFGVIFSVIFYGERPTAQIIIGFIIVFLAVIVSELAWKEIYDKYLKKKDKSKQELNNNSDECIDITTNDSNK